MEEVLYFNPLSGPADVADWVIEGPVEVFSHQQGPGNGPALALGSSADEAEAGDHSHWTLWCPQAFPDRIRITWDFLPLSEPGLAMMFFAAKGHGGRDLFSPLLAPRTGFYPQYHSGDLDALHVSYFRHKHAEERAFRTCNLRKSSGFELVAQAADPLPPAEDALDFFAMELIKDGRTVSLSINSLLVLRWVDQGSKVLGGGYVGLRQMAPLRAAYRNLVVANL
jgi:hypothetical protein